MYALTSWGLFVVAVAGAGYYYTTNRGQKKRGSGWKPFTPAQARARDASKQRRDNRDKRRKDDEGNGSDRAIDDILEKPGSFAQSSGSEAVRKRKGNKQEPSKLAQTSIIDTAEQDDTNDVDEEDLAFARQLQDKRTGTSLKKQDGPQNKKARKQAKRAEAAVAAQNPGSPQTAAQNSTASSTTGAEADDDLSSSTSLDLGPTPSGGDVSDMLEAPKKGPSVLRVTEPENPQIQKQQKPQKPAQEQETKKQRQNRQKREAEKAVREVQEKERQKLLENQRRSAREARGEPAKNGLGTSQQPVKNAWTGTTKAGGNTNTMPPAGGSLLDTFADEPNSTSGSKTSAKSRSNKDDVYSGLLSEEEQMKLLTEMDSDNGWNTVSKAGKKVKPKAGGDGQGATGGGDNSGSVFPKGAPGTVLNAQASGVQGNADVGAGSKTRKKARAVNGNVGPMEHAEDSAWGVS